MILDWGEGGRIPPNVVRSIRKSRRKDSPPYSPPSFFWLLGLTSILEDSHTGNVTSRASQEDVFGKPKIETLDLTKPVCIESSIEIKPRNASVTVKMVSRSFDRCIMGVDGHANQNQAGFHRF